MVENEKGKRAATRFVSDSFQFGSGAAGCIGVWPAVEDLQIVNHDQRLRLTLVLLIPAGLGGRSRRFSRKFSMLAVLSAGPQDIVENERGTAASLRFVADSF